MIYSFITDKDLDATLKEYFLTQVIGSNTTILKNKEAAAFTLMKSKLSHRYDLTVLFPIIKEYDVTKPWAVGSYTSKGDVIYKALIASSNTNQQDPATALTYWTPSDPRDMLLVEYCVDITIYFVLKRINPRKISQDVADNYNMAIDWLEDVMKEKENPDWTLLPVGQGMDIR